ncbi:ABC transporter substrate-binding protein [Microvirga rosea]|uniref:ABC transporter substrate-binding protein n=1 Tax=Microvirga rosea TaxID=2715425 RepID=UPI001D0B4257|nr:sugar ABC transporter substrate-binding protein [Microvirga rosea]MCB8822531.1 sugar ABC transporter substrate-binding protein [Microvirga rosea]
MKLPMVKMKSRPPVLANLMCAAVLMVAPVGTAYAQGASSPNAPAEIKIMANEAFANSWQTQLVPEFNKRFPNVKVVIDGVPYAELLPKMMLDAVNADPEYDILVIDDPWVPQLAAIGALADLKSKDIAAITSPDYDWSDFNTAPLAAGEWKGKQYAVPVRSNMLLMFYNRTLYKKAGVPEPTPNLTWDEFFKQAKTLVQDTNGDGKEDAWAVDTYFVRDSLTPTIWQAILNSNGGKLLDETGAPAFNNEAGAKALDMHKDLAKYGPPGVIGHGYSEALQAFRQAKVAVMFNWGSVYKATAIDANTTTLKEEEVGIQVMPVGSARAGTHRGIWNAGISSKTDNLQASWTFLQWLSSKEGEKVNASLLGSFPARKSTLGSKPEEKWLEPVYRTLQQSYELAAEGEMWRIRSPKSNAAQQILADEVARAIAGQVSTKEALQAAATKIKSTLK